VPNSAHDVAAAVLTRVPGPISTMKLQKLVYYCQAWNLAWFDEPLFRERVEAWAKGPVVPVLFRQHRGVFEVGAWPQGDPGLLSLRDQQVVESVVRAYGSTSAHTLSELTHAEGPWLKARSGAEHGARSNTEIGWASMRDYYRAQQ